MFQWKLKVTGSVVIYRNGFAIEGNKSDQSNIIERSTILGLEESNRFYPAIQLVTSGTKNAEDVASAVIPDIVGEA